MTSNSQRLLERARELIESGADADERIDSLVLRGRLPSAVAQSEWLTLSGSVPAPFTSLNIYDPGLGDELSPGDGFAADRDLVITIGKPVAPECAAFLLQDAVAPLLSERIPPFRILVADLDLRHAFRARGLEVLPWHLREPIAVSPRPDPLNPTRYVRDFVPAREVVTDLNPWLLLETPVLRSPLFEQWEALSSRRLLGALVSRTWAENGDIWLQASGPPIYNIRADDPSLKACRAHLTEAASWVYLSGVDIEARHLLFAGELARANRSGQSLEVTLQRAIEAAKGAYEAHIQSASRETLKALADLRRTVIDETQKVAQRAQDLTATLWRDVAVSAAPFVLKILGDAGKISDTLIAAFFYFVAAAFIVLSFILQWRINAAYFKSQASSRRQWMQTLYSYISAREREEIAETPIQQALDNYRETRNTLIVVYVLLAMVLAAGGIHGLYKVWMLPASGGASSVGAPDQKTPPPTRPAAKQAPAPTVGPSGKPGE